MILMIDETKLVVFKVKTSHYKPMLNLIMKKKIQEKKIQEKKIQFTPQLQKRIFIKTLHSYKKPNNVSSLLNQQYSINIYFF